MEIRQLKESELSQAVQLADRIFRDTEQTSMWEAFPQVFTNGDIHSFGAFDGGKLVSFIGLVPATITVGPATLYVFSLGSVCTDENYRGQGISTKILQEVYEYIEKAGASLLFVSGDRGMYARNHCYHFGKVTEYKLNQNNVQDVQYDGKIRNGNKQDVFALQELRQKKFVCFDTTVWEWSLLLSSSGLSSIHKQKQAVYVAENNGVVEGYVVIGMQTDGSKAKQSFVTESGGEPTVVHAILNEIIQCRKTEEIILHLPWHETNEEVFDLYYSGGNFHGGTVHLVKLERLIEQLTPYFQAKTCEDMKLVKKNEDEYLLANKTESILLTEQQLIAWLFTPGTDIAIEKLSTVPIPLPNPEGMYFV